VVPQLSKEMLNLLIEKEVSTAYRAMHLLLFFFVCV
jgi:hypothetical protein